MKLKTITLVILVSLSTTIGCNSAQATVTPATIVATEPVSAAVAQSTATTFSLPSLTFTPVSTFTPIPTVTPTGTNTPTIAPSFTPTLTPSATPNVKQPGFYTAGGCVTYGLNLGQYDFRAASLDFCVISVEINRDYSMVFTVSWTIHLPTGVVATKRSDENNTRMYIMDNLGNTYSHIGTSGSAAQPTRMVDGDTAYGSFVFLPAAPGAYSFTFYDDDNRVSIGGIVLTTPIQIYGDLVLKWYPYILEYRLVLWEASTTEEGNGVLTHIDMPNCQITEISQSVPQGTLINTIDIGTIKYNIYRYYEQNWSVREYIVVDGLENMDPSAPPFLRVTIPYDTTDTCLLDVSEVLANLRPPLTEMP